MTLEALWFEEAAMEQDDKQFVNIIDIDDSNFQETISEGVVLIDVYADWCTKCKIFIPSLFRLHDKYWDKITICKLNADDAPNTIAQMGIKSLPAAFVYVQGELKHTFIDGQVNEQAIDDVLRAYN